MKPLVERISGIRSSSDTRLRLGGASGSTSGAYLTTREAFFWWNGPREGDRAGEAPRGPLAPRAEHARRPRPAEAEVLSRRAADAVPARRRGSPAGARTHP